MTATYTGTNIVVVPSLLDDSTATSYDLFITQNCCGEGTKIDLRNLPIEGVSLAANNIVFSPRFYGVDTFPDGVYCIKIVLKFPDGSCKKSYAHVFVDDQVKCEVLASISNGDYTAHTLYEAIKSSENCNTNNCNCKAACQMFKDLLEQMGKKEIKVNEYTEPDCGCS